ncbi:MAG TPA: aminoacyl-tRNA hydrolase [Candidatus Binatia bacterium]|nr:aminoacyl-tRNA hydrolase [Candidatus Binatia bacterium]
MPATELRAIIGLGNPGNEYSRTRHNAGFWLVEAVAEKFGGSFRKESRFHGLLADTTVGGTRLWLLEPQTWMNGSGRAVQSLMAFHKLAPDQIVVAHDELDLPPGTVRLKIGGGHGGHNGLRDIHAQVGDAYRRLRIGVGHPGQKEMVTPWLTSGRPSAADEQLIREGIAAAVEALPLALTQWEKATQQLHSRDVLPTPPSP